MTLAGYVRTARERWVTVASTAALGLATAAGFVLLQHPVFAANSQMFVRTIGASDPSQLYNGGSFTQQRVKSYAALVTSEAVMRSVIGQLKLKNTADQLRAHIDAVAPPDTVLIDVNVKDSSPSRARDIANAVADAFGTYASKLEAGGAASRVAVVTTRRAALPSAPVSPQRTTDLALGLLLGLAAGVGLAVAQDHRDDRIRRRDDLVKLPAGLPLLGVLPDIKPSGEVTGSAERDAHVLSEAARRLGAHVRHLAVSSGARSVLVTGYGRGEGATTTAITLAMCLASTGSSVLLLDTDLRQPQLAARLSLLPRPGLADLLEDFSPPRPRPQPSVVARAAPSLLRAVQPWPGIPTLHVIAAGETSAPPGDLLGSTAMRDLMDALTRRFAFVIVDSPALSESADVSIVAPITDAALIVARVNATRAHHIESALQVFASAGTPTLGLVLTHVPRRGVGADLAQASTSTPMRFRRPEQPRPGASYTSDPSPAAVD